MISWVECLIEDDTDMILAMLTTVLRPLVDTPVHADVYAFHTNRLEALSLIPVDLWKNLHVKLGIASHACYTMLREPNMEVVLAHCHQISIMHLFQPINGLIDIVQSLKYGAKVKLRCDYDVTDVTEACLARPDVYVYDPDHWSP